MNYYKIFDFSVAPDIDKEKLLHKYLFLQRKAHSNDIPNTPNVPIDLLNKSFNVMNDDISRYEHYLELVDKNFSKKINLEEEFWEYLFSILGNFESLENNERTARVRKIKLEIRRYSFFAKEELECKKYEQARISILKVKSFKKVLSDLSVRFAIMPYPYY